MKYTLMVIDDAPDRREEQYRKILASPELDPIFIWTRSDLDKHRDVPVDGYLIDIFLDRGDWRNSNAAEVLREVVEMAPRRSPVFLVSQFWGEERVLDVLKQAGESSPKVVQYLAWSEFQEASEDGDLASDRLEALRRKIISELNLWHGRSDFRPGPDDTIRILVLADVQFGDPGTDPAATFAEHWIAHTLKRNHEVPHLLVLAGDVSHSGRPDQFELAEERLALDLIVPLWGKNNIDRMRDRIVLVPGNHDVNLRFSACDKFKFDLKRKMFEQEGIPSVGSGKSRYRCHHDYALEPFRRFGSRLTRDRNLMDSVDLSWVDRRFVYCGIRFFVLNSVANVSSSLPDVAAFGERAIRELNRSLVDDDPDSIFSIAVSHHGLPGESLSKGEKKVEDWVSVGRDAFSMHKVRIWLFGHYHVFGARSTNEHSFEKEPLWLVQAPTPRVGYSNRGFCLLELHRQAGVVCDAYIHYYVLENASCEKRSSRRVFEKG